VVTSAVPESIADAIEILKEDTSLFQEKQQNSVVARDENRWIDRASKVASDLTK
jgi:hypothetical protein